MTQENSNAPLNLFGPADDSYIGTNEEEEENEEIPEEDSSEESEDIAPSVDDERANFIPPEEPEDIAGDGVPPDAKELIEHHVTEKTQDNTNFREEINNNLQIDKDTLVKLNHLLDQFQELFQKQQKMHEDINSLIEALYENNQKFNGHLNLMPVLVKNHMDEKFKDYFDNVVKNFNAMKKASFVWYKNMDNDKSEAAKKIYSSAKLIPYATALIFACLIAIIIK